MNILLKKVAAIAALPIATTGLVVGLIGSGPAFAYDMPGTVSDPTATPAALANGDASVSASTKTVPWCGWTVRGLPETLTLSDTSVTAGETSKYVGSEISLAGASGSISAFVSGTGAAATADVDNCSWYGDDNKQGLAMTVRASGAGFTATAAEGGADAGMGFLLTEAKPLSITPTYAASCANGFTTSDALNVFGDSLTSNPVTTKDKASVSTTTACSWTLAYATKIPAGKEPKFGDQVYTFTGPTLTTTVNIN